MPFLLLSLAIQAALIVHVIRNGRNQLWIMAIAFLPVAGSLAYLVVEILPGMRGQRHVRAATAKVAKTIDPERDLRAARDALDLADTAANQARLGDALAGLGRYGEAIAPYRAALERGPGRDRTIAVKLARALFEDGAAQDALDMLDSVPAAGSPSVADRETLLRAQALAAVGREAEAASLYADIVTRLPGDEARCRQAALLIAMHRPAEARAVLEEVARRERRLDRLARAQDAEMYDWSRRTLADL